MNKKILLAILLMGFTSLITQTLLIREFLVTFQGNEFTIGIILANWIMLEALGSFSASRLSSKVRRPYLSYALFQSAIAIYLPLAIFLIRILKNLLGLTLGEGIGIIPVFFTSLGLMSLLSFLDGAQFPFACRILADKSAKPVQAVSKVYILEAVGFLIASPLFTLLLIAKINSFSIALFLSLLNLLCAVLLIKEEMPCRLLRYSLILTSILSVLAASALFGPADILQKLSIDRQYRGQKVIKYQNSVYGNLAVLQAKNQYTFYSDGIPIITTPLPDISYVEDVVHFSMLSCPNPKNILILSGAAGGILQEILKYNVDKITYVELDPLLISLLKEFPSALTQKELYSPKVKVGNIDGRLFLRDKMRGNDKYDVIILNLPLPLTLQLNRLYTEEFFGLVKSHLNQEGVFSLSLPGSLTFLSPSLRELNSCILNTLEGKFYVSVIPGSYNLFIARNQNSPITPQLLMQNINRQSIPTKIFNAPYLQERMHPQWLKKFNDSLGDYRRVRKNSDLFPSGVFYSIAYWNSIFSPHMQRFFNTLDALNMPVLLLGLAMLTIALLAWRLVSGRKKMAVAFAIGTTGFTGMSINLVLIYAYQAFLGLVFTHLAMLTGAFMSGLALGGWSISVKLDNIKNARSSLLLIEALTVIFLAMLTFVFSYPGPLIDSAVIIPLFFILSGICGFLVGLEFPLANKIYHRERSHSQEAGILYAFDLGGAWLAALAVSVAMVPVIGIIPTCVFLIALKGVSFLLLAL